MPVTSQPKSQPANIQIKTKNSIHYKQQAGTFPSDGDGVQRIKV
jgi:hypothetical protein